MSRGRMVAGKSRAHPLVISQKSEAEAETETETEDRKQRMDMQQILILGLFFVPVWSLGMPRCYEDHELSGAAERKLRSHYPQPPEPSHAAAPDSPASCPVALFLQPPQHIHDRSLSPWRYVLVTKEDHFPSTYAEAQCLCSGCVLIQDKRRPVESHDYNSVPIKQSRVFLKKELCEDGKTYQLKPVSVKVAVGCTCARAKSSP